MAFADTLRALNTMKADGVVQEYAIAGAMAIVFWAEPVPTFDLDVLVLLPPSEGALVMELQRIVLPLIARQRPLRSWERPWEIEA